jgi:exodeoxyribonuclease V alpha subunit
MKAEHRLQPLAGHARELLRVAAKAEGDLVDRCAARLFEVLEEGGSCLPLAELGEAAEVETRLLASAVAGRAGENYPLILDGGNAYFQRYHVLETSLAARLKQFAAVRTRLPAKAEGALASLLGHGLALVTGGPGTGKTFLAGRLLRLLAEEAPERTLSVILAAPTGRAAARLKESVSRALDGILNVKLLHGTVHSLLGIGSDATKPRRDAETPLPADIVVLDESSMMDLPLMARFAAGVDPVTTRLILLGDPGQLPAIHTGSVLADMVAAAANESSPLFPCLTELKKNHRSAAPELAALISAVQGGDAEAALAILDKGGAVSMEPPPSPRELAAFTRRNLSSFVERIANAASPQEALAAASSERLVCMLRQGSCGAEAVNAAAFNFAAERMRAGTARFFHGLPVIVSRNDPASGLFNGDTGVVLRRGGTLSAYFPGFEGVREISLAALPPVESAYAITVHRAQGSEYGGVTLLLPEKDHPMLSRELFYTGISRAGRELKVLATPAVLRAALPRQCRRSSGLAARLA